MLPNNEFSFHYTGKGETTGEQYFGDFTVKSVLSNAEQMEVAIRVDRYSGGSRTLAEQFKLFNRIFAELELRVIKSPKFWSESNNGWDLHDANIVHEVFTEAMKAPKIWADRIKAKAEEIEKATAPEVSPSKKE